MISDSSFNLKNLSEAIFSNSENSIVVLLKPFFQLLHFTALSEQN
jgi:hypothetical protein